MQAITVLLLELTQRTSNLFKDPFYIFACIENLVQWLKALKSVDRVAANAYSLVCDMLRKYKRFAKDAVPEQWLADETELADHDANMFAELSFSSTYHMSDQQYTPRHNAYPFHASHEEHISIDEDAFGGYLFGQTQSTPLHSSQFTTLFDQQMEDDGDDTGGGGAWHPPFE